LLFLFPTILFEALSMAVEENEAEEEEEEEGGK